MISFGLLSEGKEGISPYQHEGWGEVLVPAPPERACGWCAVCETLQILTNYMQARGFWKGLHRVSQRNGISTFAFVLHYHTGNYKVCLKFLKENENRFKE